MGIDMKKLTAVQVKNITKPGNYADGDGLRMKVSKAGSKAWLYRYRIHGKAHEMGLGTYPTRSLKGAREETVRLRKLVLDGIDPLIEKSKLRQKAQDVLTFDQCTDKFHEMKKAEWSSELHAKKWLQAMRNHCSPVIGNLPVSEIDTEHVLRVVQPIWTKKTVLASNLRERIESVLSWSASIGYREKGLNPAIWRGHLEHLLPKKNKVHKAVHHPALEYQEIGKFMKELREVDTTASQALQFTILTACRSKEVFGATWDEIDLDKAVWVIPGSRMKMRKDHRVPLSKHAVELLEELPGSGYVFPSTRHGWVKPIADTQMWRLMKRLRPSLTVHGFRSSFRQWAAEQTNYPREVAEQALAHAAGDSTEQAYQRSDLLDKRRPLMQAWADHCEKVNVSADVVGIRSMK